MNPKELPKQIQEDDELRIKLEKEEAIFSLKQYIKEDILNPEFLLNLQWHREKMLMQYKTPVIKTKIILFKAKYLNKMFQYEAKFNWWENFTVQPIALFLVPGDHESIFSEPNIKILAHKLNDVLREKEFNDPVIYCY